MGANEPSRLTKQTAQDLINIGQRLIEVKEQLGNGRMARS